ncbi:MAG: LysM peptidoglycan-binding domain-containing protein [Acidobacteriota bacterium]
MRNPGLQTSFTSAWTGRSSRRARRAPSRSGSATALLALSFLAAGCGHSASKPPEDAASARPLAAGAVSASPLPAHETAAEKHLAAGGKAYREGRYQEARAQFEAAMRLYLEGEMLPADQQQQRRADFDDLFHRVHALELESLLQGPAPHAGADERWMASSAKEARKSLETARNTPERLDPQPPLRYDEATVDVVTDLRVVAEAAGTTLETIRTLNPDLGMTTPAGDETTVRIPQGAAQRFATALAAIPAAEPPHFIRHRVRRGETLSTIASDYGTTIGGLQQLNDLAEPDQIVAGSPLLVPVGRAERFYSGPAVSGLEEGERIVYTVQPGDGLHQIASAFRTSVLDLMRRNDLGSDLVYPGTELIAYFGVRDRIPAAETATDGGTETQGRIIYTVRTSDSFATIARRFGLPVERLKGWNYRTHDVVYAGDKIVVYTSPQAADNTSPRRHDENHYTVQPGDAPYKIARRFGVSLEDLLAANGLSANSTIYPGDELTVPGASGPAKTLTYTVRSGDRLDSVAAHLAVPLDRLCQLNGLTPTSTLYPGERLILPNQ